VTKCEQCSIHKSHIEEIQEKLNDADKRLQSMDKLKDEHDKETIYRKHMEEKWNEKLEEHKNKAIIICITFSIMTGLDLYDFFYLLYLQAKKYLNN